MTSRAADRRGYERAWSDVGSVVACSTCAASRRLTEAGRLHAEGWRWETRRGRKVWHCPEHVTAESRVRYAEARRT